eukprot:CAMPEP_0170644624 /NCGR_PEP_ID=MMETSP0224-20130122/42595_1 /TAXON_ID=285029 /ORGANISM="Togula jolla, Strain CCCM 725" /LENGTH=38 /DNA_ID= /DNA_START= /DNA_END= /DNA_ORIENTATION=
MGTTSMGDSAVSSASGIPGPSVLSMILGVMLTRSAQLA